ncbi:DUF1508 domain-containing protein [Jiella sp. MQZ13P-4]|uniref:DUF1508 domain-containing protein n=1 Tax=Jiella sonneratiae TaxID=2816856 RepID=A0ABS3J296_9HYPH|nr:DUF1508 domain-containing protein [Jiella sonneratiae]
MRDEDIDFGDIPEFDASFWASDDAAPPADNSPRPQSGPASYTFEVYEDRSGEYRVRFMFNSEVVFSTTSYRTKSDAHRGIETIKRHMAEAGTIGID